jgi:hypothetical protein
MRSSADPDNIRDPGHRPVPRFATTGELTVGELEYDIAMT